MKNNKLKKLLVFIFISVWFYTGWPVIWHNPRIPPEIKEARAVSDTYSTAGSFTWTAPTGIYSVQVECWGAGGGGSIGNAGGGGGGGGAYARSVVNVTPGTGYAITVGAGGSTDVNSNGNNSTFATTTVVADGGASTNGNTAGAAGLASLSTGDVTADGGAGGVGNTNGDVGGGGGGAAGPAGAGNAGEAGVSNSRGGAGGSGNAGSGGTSGTSGNGACPTGNGGPGGDHANGGGGGGGGDTTCKGNVGGNPGGGGGSSETTGAVQTGGAGQCIVTYTDTWAPSIDLGAYTPTWTFASAPTHNTTQITLVATTGYDYTTINYQFVNDNSNCGADAGTGGSNCTWQSSTSCNDTVLQANKCYGYTVQARDTTPNTGTASTITSAYTSAMTPGTPTLTNATLTTLRLTNDNNTNPTTNPTTYFAVQVVTTSPNDSTWINQWVDASGNPSATEVWQTDTALDALTLTGLEYGTIYGVKVKAKNENGDETPLSAEGQGTTTAAVISVSITANGTITYGTLGFEVSKSTVDLGTTPVAQNDGNIPEDFTIKTSDASTGIGWTIGSAPGTNIFVYESSPNGGSTWTKFTTADSYQSFVPSVTNVGVGATQRFDLKITTPTLSDGVTKNITVTVLATQH